MFVKSTVEERDRRLLPDAPPWRSSACSLICLFRYLICLSGVWADLFFLCRVVCLCGVIMARLSMTWTKRVYACVCTAAFRSPEDKLVFRVLLPLSRIHFLLLSFFLVHLLESFPKILRFWFPGQSCVNTARLSETWLCVYGLHGLVCIAWMVK